jgi:hypothetical protein
MSDDQPNLEAIKRRWAEMLLEFRAIHNDLSRPFGERVDRERQLIDELIDLNRIWSKAISDTLAKVLP